MNKALMSIFSSLWLFSASAFAQVRELPAPSGRGSGQPNLAVAPDGRVYLSWIERLGEGRFSLRFALKEGDDWSAPRVITGQELIAASTAAPMPECVRRRLFEAARRRVIVTNLHHDRPSDLGPRRFQQKPRRVHHRADTAARQYRTAATRSRPKH